MLSSKILAAAERNVSECAFKGQNSKEILDELPVVLLFGDDYQLFPVIDEGAIRGYSKMNDKLPQTPTTRLTPSQLICQRGNYLFTHVMSETVFTLDIPATAKISLRAPRELPVSSQRACNSNPYLVLEIGTGQCF
jgi:hypothetical protein